VFFFFFLNKQAFIYRQYATLYTTIHRKSILDTKIKGLDSTIQTETEHK